MQTIKQRDYDVVIYKTFHEAAITLEALKRFKENLDNGDVDSTEIIDEIKATTNNLIKEYGYIF